MKLSKYFVLEEFTRSNTSQRNNIDNTPSEEVVDSIKRLCVNVLDPIREMFGPVTISSGYRNAKLNKLVGGSTTSQHVTGEAADITFGVGVDKVEVAKWILNSGLEFDQMIVEAYNKADLSKGWLHISLSNSDNRREVLTAVFKSGKAVYTPGLPC